MCQKAEGCDIDQKKPMIILTGPTAVGKTKLSLELARRVHGEIISADSMQVYEYMDIGSAKIMPEEMQGIPHHMIGVLKPWDSFDVVEFQRLCKEVLTGIYERGSIPIVTGGTGFYIQALLRNIDFTENEEDTKYRQQLEELATQKGSGYLHEMLEKVDPRAAEAIHENNMKRTIRALEFYHLTGQCISEHVETRKVSLKKLDDYIKENNIRRSVRPVSERLVSFHDYDMFEYAMENDKKWHDIAIEGLGWLSLNAQGQVLRVRLPKGVAIKESLAKIR